MVEAPWCSLPQVGDRLRHPAEPGQRELNSDGGKIANVIVLQCAQANIIVRGMTSFVLYIPSCT
jgi:hypothetical protein